MHMYMWFGYDLGEFMFAGLTVDTQWAFALTWLVLFVVALLFEGSKVYLARVQREAHKKLYPYRSDERRNLLYDRDRLNNASEPGTSRNASSGQVSRWTSLRVRVLVNFHQTGVFLLHNLVGYLLMLAVMVYNVHLVYAVVLGMMLGYFLFGTKLTLLQMQCFNRKKLVICTPECDDTAQTTTPPLLDSSLDSESDFFICRTRTCIQPSHYFPTREGAGDVPHCSYGAKKCPSMVARAKKIRASKHCHEEVEKEDSPSVEDVQLLRTERQGCCKKKQEPPPESCCGTKEVQVEGCCQHGEGEGERKEARREESPQITCCHSGKAPTESQEQIIK